jgi:hypothetical protein
MTNYDDNTFMNSLVIFGLKMAVLAVFISVGLTIAFFASTTANAAAKVANLTPVEDAKNA